MAKTDFGDVAKTGFKNRIVRLYPQMNETIDNIISKYKEKGNPERLPFSIDQKI